MFQIPWWSMPLPHPPVRPLSPAEQGANAAFYELPQDANPYPADTDDYALWDQGYNQIATHRMVAAIHYVRGM